MCVFGDFNLVNPRQYKMGSLSRGFELNKPLNAVNFDFFNLSRKVIISHNKAILRRILGQP